MRARPEFIDAADRCGRLLFGKPSRLRLGMWIATREAHGQRTFCQVEYWDWLAERGLPKHPLGADLRRFEQLEMLRERFDVEDLRYGRRARWWTRLESPLWDILLIASVVLDEHVDFSAEQRRKTLRQLIELRDSLHGRAV